MLVRTLDGLFEFDSVILHSAKGGNNGAEYTIAGKNRDRLCPEPLLTVSGSHTQMSTLLDKVIDSSFTGMLDFTPYDDKKEVINMALVIVNHDDTIDYHSCFLASDVIQTITDLECMGSTVYGLSISEVESDGQYVVYVDKCAGPLTPWDFSNLPVSRDRVKELFAQGGFSLPSSWEFVLGDEHSINRHQTQIERTIASWPQWKVNIYNKLLINSGFHPIKTQSDK